jgi:hypothetical protein
MPEAELRSYEASTHFVETLQEMRSLLNKPQATIEEINSNFEKLTKDFGVWGNRVIRSNNATDYNLGDLIKNFTMFVNARKSETGIKSILFTADDVTSARIVKENFALLEINNLMQDLNTIIAKLNGAKTTRKRGLFFATATPMNLKNSAITKINTILSSTSQFGAYLGNLRRMDGSSLSYSDTSATGSIPATAIVENRRESAASIESIATQELGKRDSISSLGSGDYESEDISRPQSTNQSPRRLSKGG